MQIIAIKDAASLRAALDELNWSQAELARRTGYNANTVTRWMNSGALPTWLPEYLGALLAIRALAQQVGILATPR